MRAAENTVEYQVAQEDADKALRDLMSDVRNDLQEEVDMSEAVVPGFRDGIMLLPHQIVGRKWMAERESGKRTGGILADDMGLGKTIQTITRIVEGRAPKSAKQAGFAATTLVICPVAVVSQWASEIQKMAVGLTVIEHHGQNRTADPLKLSGGHVVVTSYNTVASEYAAYSQDAKDESKGKSKKVSSEDAEDSEGSTDEIRKYLQKNKKKPTSRAHKTKDALFRLKYWRIVLDEAHNIKNRNTKTAQACFALQGKYRWCLTGTPMQNNVEELFSLMKFLKMRPLDDWANFKEKIAQPIKNGRPQRAIKRLHASVVLNACMLRRTKNDTLNGKPLLELPDRIVQTVHCEFDAEERAFYDSVQERVQTSLENIQRQGGMAKNYTSVLVLLLRLRQACNHPSLIAQDYRKDKEAVDPKAAKDDKDLEEDADDLAELMGGLGLSAAATRCQMCQRALTPLNMGRTSDHCARCDEVFEKAKRKSMATNPTLPPSSAKIRKIIDILDEIEERGEGEKTIIFSQFTSMLDLIEPFLKANSIKYVRYDGSMTKPLREEALDKIKTKDKVRVILISFKAGSTGLNLTCCNNVILVDLWWNPALEDQAFDRAHRMGQKRTVNIHKLSIPDTVEERILQLQEKKRALAQAALSGDKMKNMKLGLDDLMALFRHGGDDHDDDEEDDE
ncbi:SNF2 family N-terminal domain-containing protein [Irpex rosettiformis]|uniref:SNF2 family N-terminal domain-containing protein n=1 Tax=Irpex rosettiformis TaxID=378272 RepID=A0ACB8U1Y8_9APHY|nr:SNF2 family N-terminal domain-containing protein [Irpex rosettiformis]